MNRYLVFLWNSKMQMLDHILKKYFLLFLLQIIIGEAKLRSIAVNLNEDGCSCS